MHQAQTFFLAEILWETMVFVLKHMDFMGATHSLFEGWNRFDPIMVYVPLSLFG